MPLFAHHNNNTNAQSTTEPNLNDIPRDADPNYNNNNNAGTNPRDYASSGNQGQNMMGGAGNVNKPLPGAGGGGGLTDDVNNRQAYTSGMTDYQAQGANEVLDEPLPGQGQRGHHHHHQHRQDEFGNQGQFNDSTNMSGGGAGMQNRTAMGGGAQQWREQERNAGTGTNDPNFPQHQSNLGGTTGTGLGSNNTRSDFASSGQGNQGQNFSSGGGQNLSGGTGAGTGVGSNVPTNSQGLAEQAEAKARESSAMQKQSVEVREAEKLEKAAMQARERAVNAGAHPLHGQVGGINSNDMGRGSQP